MLPVLLLFFAMLLLIIFCKDWLVKINVNPAVVRAGNLLMAILTIITIAIQHRALQNSNPNVFIRSVMSTMLIKMLVIALSLIIYAQSVGNAINTKGIFAVLILYLVYLVAEVTIVMKLNRKKDG